MTAGEMIKIIPVIKQIWDSVKSSSQNIKIEVFPNQEFRKPTCPCHDMFCKHYEGRPANLRHQKDSVGICITNYGKESIRLDQITLNVYIKKGIFCKTKIYEEKNEKFTRLFPSTILSGKDGRLSFPKFDSSEKSTVIYEVIAEIDNRKIKHLHKVSGNHEN
jgi:hypothetical protein